MRPATTALLGVALGGLPGLAGAIDLLPGAGLGLDFKASTLGAGVELSGTLSSSLTGRVGVNALSRTDTRRESDIDYSGELNLRSVTAGVDWHPFSSGFRVSLGYLLNGSDLDMAAEPRASYSLNGTDYAAADVGALAAEVEMDSGAYLGIGWGNSGKRKGLGLTADLGVVFQGAPRVSMSASGRLADPSDPLYDPAFVNDLDAEASALQQELDEFKYYPVFSLGLRYGF